MNGAGTRPTLVRGFLFDGSNGDDEGSDDTDDDDIPLGGMLGAVLPKNWVPRNYRQPA
jgi:hypothetical protein